MPMDAHPTRLLSDLWGEINKLQSDDFIMARAGGEIARGRR